MKSRDRQRARVYAWEEQAVAPHGRDLIPFSAAQAMVDSIWTDLGLCWPPKVERLPRQARTLRADASRLIIRMPDALPSYLLLHEIAHALTSTAEDGTDGHGPAFMGLYLQLIMRYLRLPEEELICSLNDAGIRYDRSAKPAFVTG
jgi:hypothetical protein